MFRRFRNEGLGRASRQAPSACSGDGLGVRGVWNGWWGKVRISTPRNVPCRRRAHRNHGIAAPQTMWRRGTEHVPQSPLISGMMVDQATQPLLQEL